MYRCPLIPYLTQAVSEPGLNFAKRGLEGYIDRADHEECEGAGLGHIFSRLAERASHQVSAHESVVNPWHWDLLRKFEQSSEDMEALRTQLHEILDGYDVHV